MNTANITRNQLVRFYTLQNAATLIAAGRNLGKILRDQGLDKEAKAAVKVAKKAMKWASKNSGKLGITPAMISRYNEDFSVEFGTPALTNLKGTVL